MLWDPRGLDLATLTNNVFPWGDGSPVAPVVSAPGKYGIELLMQSNACVRCYWKAITFESDRWTRVHRRLFVFDCLLLDDFSKVTSPGPLFGNRSGGISLPITTRMVCLLRITMEVVPWQERDFSFLSGKNDWFVIIERIDWESNGL